MSGTFSESWHRVSRMRTALRPTVRAHQQRFRGEWWVVLHDPFNNAFFRLRPAAYRFVVRLSLRRTVDEVWQEAMTADPDGTPGQGDTLQLLSQLNGNNLLWFDVAADSAKLQGRQTRQRKKGFVALAMSLMFLRMPLFDPDRVLDGLRPVFGVLFGRLGVLVWLAVLLAGGKLAIDHVDALTAGASTVIAPDNLLLLFVATVVIKAIHEFGHAAACKHFGGEVHSIGIMLMVFSPLPYVDATASWGLRSRWQRAFVGAAGMYAELFVAAVAVFVWAHAPPGVVRALAYNVLFMASVTTVVFNANPLLRFDGYYILSDLIEQPNLTQRARAHLQAVAERLLFGLAPPPDLARDSRRAAWALAGFGAVSAVYRVIISVGLVLFVADSYLLLGAAMAVILGVSGLVGPPVHLVRYLARGRRLADRRGRAVAIVLAIAVEILAVVVLVPVPNRFRAPGIVESTSVQEVFAATSGQVVEILAIPGAPVQAGAPLVRLANPDLDLSIADAAQQLAEIEVQETMALSRQGVDLSPIVRRRQAVLALQDHLRRQRDELVLRAQRDGVWAAPTVRELIGRWTPRGTAMGKVIDPRSFRFVAVVSQEDAGQIFDLGIRALSVRLNGQGGRDLAVAGHEVLPFQKDVLPSAALGWLGGGDVAVAETDPEGLRALEPFFLVTATLDPDPSAVLAHGHAGQLRIALEPQPLGWQVERAIRQFFQKRYVT